MSVVILVVLFGFQVLGFTHCYFARLAAKQFQIEIAAHAAGVLAPSAVRRYLFNPCPDEQPTLTPVGAELRR
jgi:hypothetical protein